jgi:serine/threonine protein kinase
VPWSGDRTTTRAFEIDTKDHMMAHPPAKTIKSIGSYHVLKTLGKGAHSSIFHVRRSEDGSQYALKLVPIDSPDDLKYLEQAQHEFRVAQMLDHPNLIKVFALENSRASPSRSWCRSSSGSPMAWCTCTAARCVTAT